jgi:hypothetical protein
MMYDKKPANKSPAGKKPMPAAPMHGAKKGRDAGEMGKSWDEAFKKK